MNRAVIFLVSLLLLFSIPGTGWTGSVPHEIAGIKLGAHVEDYPDIEFSNYLKEMVVTDWHGFRKGIISYGICENPGTIIKIRMKYQDSTKYFFKKLLKKFKQRYGEPSEWKGDSFGIRHIWKWRFTDEKGDIVNMILKHNLKDHNDDIGNVVKLAYPEREELERLCFIEMCEEPRDPEHQKRMEKRKQTDWKFLLPN